MPDGVYKDYHFKWRFCDFNTFTYISKKQG